MKVSKEQKVSGNDRHLSQIDSGGIIQDLGYWIIDGKATYNFFSVKSLKVVVRGFTEKKTK